MHVRPIIWQLTKSAHGSEAECEGLNDKQAGNGEEDVHARAPERSALVDIRLSGRIGNVHLRLVYALALRRARKTQTHCSCNSDGNCSNECYADEHSPASDAEDELQGTRAVYQEGVHVDERLTGGCVNGRQRAQKLRNSPVEHKDIGRVEHSEETGVVEDLVGDEGAFIGCSRVGPCQCRAQRKRRHAH